MKVFIEKTDCEKNCGKRKTKSMGALCHAQTSNNKGWTQKNIRMQRYKIFGFCACSRRKFGEIRRKEMERRGAQSERKDLGIDFLPFFYYLCWGNNLRKFCIKVKKVNFSLLAK
jgi:hypothetical protein